MEMPTRQIRAVYDDKTIRVYQAYSDPIADSALEHGTFYKALEQRIAQYRKKQGLTQVQLAEKLDIAQQTMAHYEGGSLRIAVALLKPLAQELNVSIEELINEPKTAAKGKRGPSFKLQQQVEQISHMPRSKQKFISEMLDALIAQQKAG